MMNYLSRPCTAFAGTQQIASAALVDVALAIKHTKTHAPILTFDDATGAVIDLDLRGTTAEIVTRLTQRGEKEALAARNPRPRMEGEAPKPRGRPKLGVVAREVTLLPRHWEWLASQTGGASQALRRLIDDARRSDGGQTQIKVARERTYRFLSALAGDLPGFEEVTRALFAGDTDTFSHRMEAWPTDVRNYALALLQVTSPSEKPE